MLTRLTNYYYEFDFILIYTRAVPELHELSSLETRVFLYPFLMLLQPLPQ